MSNSTKTQDLGNSFSENQFRELMIEFPVEELELCYDIAISLYGYGREAELIQEIIKWKTSKFGRELF